MFRLALAGARASLNMTRVRRRGEPHTAAEQIPRSATPARAKPARSGDPGSAALGMARSERTSHGNPRMCALQANTLEGGCATRFWKGYHSRGRLCHTCIAGFHRRESTRSVLSAVRFLLHVSTEGRAPGLKPISSTIVTRPPPTKKHQSTKGPIISDGAF